MYLEIVLKGNFYLVNKKIVRVYFIKCNGILVFLKISLVINCLFGI